MNRVLVVLYEEVIRVRICIRRKYGSFSAEFHRRDQHCRLHPLHRIEKRDRTAKCCILPPNVSSAVCSARIESPNPRWGRIKVKLALSKHVLNLLILLVNTDYMS